MDFLSTGLILRCECPLSETIRNRIQQSVEPEHCFGRWTISMIGKISGYLFQLEVGIPSQFGQNVKVQASLAKHSGKIRSFQPRVTVHETMEPLLGHKPHVLRNSRC